jgi:uncharacterized protein (DUF2147 family)
MAISKSNALWALVAGAAVLGVSGAMAETGDPSGEWLVADQSAKIRIERCADGYWGSIDWEKQAGIDTKSSDPARHGKPLLGAPILLGMKPSEDNRWEGKVYNPKDGGYYNASIQLESSNKLRLEGCMLIFCSGETWTRVSEPNQATTGAAAATKTSSVCPPRK